MKLPVASDLLQPLHVVHAGNLAHAGDDRLQVFQVGDFQHHVDACLPVSGAGFDVPDIGVIVTDHGRDLLEHSEAVVAEERNFDGIRDGLAFLVGAGPLYVNPAVGLIEQVRNIGTIYRMHGHAFAAGDVAD